MSLERLREDLERVARERDEARAELEAARVALADVQRCSASDLHGLTSVPMALYHQRQISHGRLRECIRQWTHGKREWEPADFGMTEWP